MRSIIIAISILIALPIYSLAQTDTDEQLAAQFFKNGEYDKAEVYYKKLYKRYNDEFFFQYYIDCLLNLEEFSEAEKQVEKRIKKEGDPVLYVSLGQVYKASGDEKGFAGLCQRLARITALSEADRRLGQCIPR